MFSSELASCTVDSARSAITPLSFPVADFRLGVSRLKCLSFLSSRRVSTGASPPAHTPSTPPRVLRLPRAPVGQGGWSVCRSRVALGEQGGQPRPGAGRRLSGGGSRSARAPERSREAGAGRLRLLRIPARLGQGGESAGAALPSCSASWQDHGGADGIPAGCGAQVRRVPAGTGTAALRRCRRGGVGSEAQRCSAGGLK